MIDPEDTTILKHKNTAAWLWALLLIIVEQLIKLYIYHFHFDNHFAIIPPVFYFRPMFNRDYSWYNSLLQLGVSKWMHIVITTIIIVAILLLFLFYSKRYPKSKLIHSAFVFLLAGSLCSWIDKVFWDGSLDYIQINGFFTFDLKDIYLDIAIGLILLLIVVKRKAIDRFDEKSFIKEFWEFVTLSNKKQKQMDK